MAGSRPEKQRDQRRASYVSHAALCSRTDGKEGVWNAPSPSAYQRRSRPPRAPPPPPPPLRGSCGLASLTVNARPCIS